MLKRFLYITLVAVCFSCTNEEAPTKPELLDAITSASVAFVHSTDKLDYFFQSPTKAYVSGYFYFGDDLADDVIFGLDLEWLEGLDAPVNFKGADWMALAGFNRKGILWFPIGSPENLEGTPTNTDKWEVKDIGTELEPNIWYKMTIVADFAKREFVSVRIEGDTLDKTIDISGFPLEYPNYAPFDKPSLTYYTHVLRAKDFSPTNEGSAKVYFDDLEVGLLKNDIKTVITKDGFENQTEITEIPIHIPPFLMETIAENFHYYENEKAKIKIVNHTKRSGANAIECDGDLAKTE